MRKEMEKNLWTIIGVLAGNPIPCVYGVGIYGASRNYYGRRDGYGSDDQPLFPRLICP